ncbi:MAG: hypothetical protein EXR69_03090 [Myxococcales bacterium]|nr:hypothetical protein [Myxococcales bacterium]
MRSDGSIEVRAWTPGEVVDGAVAPRMPECRPVMHVLLEDRRSDAEQGVPPAGVSMEFSPDGSLLALGTVEGRVDVIRVPRGEVVASRRLAEGAVKQVAFSADGDTLFVGEQSPDAFLYALDPATLNERWKVRLADDIDASTLPATDTMYGRYSLPGAYAVKPLVGGGLIVAGAHGWTVDGVRRNRSRIWRLSGDGAVVAAFPVGGAADAVFLFPSVSEEGAGDVLVGVSRSADGPAPAELPVGGLVDLDLETLTPRWTRTFSPLSPWFSEVFFWEAVVRGPDYAFAGLGDGRGFLLADDGSSRAEIGPGVPVDTAGVPVGVGVGYAVAGPEGVWYLTTGTNIPWGSADPAARPPAAHPAENTVHAVFPDGKPRWDRSVRHSVGGIVLSPDRAELLVAAGPRDSDSRTDLFGAIVLAADTGDWITTCSTSGPADFRPVFGPDGGWIAIAEAPYRRGDGTVAGAYQVTVFR